MKTVALTVLAYEGPMLRAYLGMMRRTGLQPRRILLMVQRSHPATKKAIGRWLPESLRVPYAQRVQEYALNYWPRRIRGSHPRLVEAMARQLTRICDDPAGLIAEMLGRVRYENYAPSVERVLVGGLGDGVLAATFSKLKPAAVLYTGGGIVPPSLLNMGGLRFLHVHPGHLPAVRGADGLLWSTLVRGRPGVSCFCLAGGIDTGAVIDAVDYPPLSFDISALPRPDDQTLYRAIFSFYDPILRADFLVSRVLEAGADPAALPASPQDPRQGITYHFMHPALRRKALERLFVSTASQKTAAHSSCRMPAAV